MSASLRQNIAFVCLLTNIIRSFDFKAFESSLENIHNAIRCFGFAAVIWRRNIRQSKQYLRTTRKTVLSKAAKFTSHNTRAIERDNHISTFIVRRVKRMMDLTAFHITFFAWEWMWRAFLASIKNSGERIGLPVKSIFELPNGRC